MSGAQLRIDKVKMLSGKSFRIAIHLDSDILLLDEVIAVGDEEFQKQCREKLREFSKNGCALSTVSHDLPVVEELYTSAI